MIRKIIHFSLHQPMFVGLLAIIFIAGGVIAFLNLPIEAFPDVSDVQVNVVTLYPGRAPEEVVDGEREKREEASLRRTKIIEALEAVKGAI